MLCLQFPPFLFPFYVKETELRALRFEARAIVPVVPPAMTVRGMEGQISLLFLTGARDEEKTLQD